MTINEYQTAALRTAQTDKLTANELLLNSALGLCGESGEVADLVKKHRFQGHDIDFDHIAKELGDVAWYLAVRRADVWKYDRFIMENICKQCLPKFLDVDITYNEEK